MHKQWSTDAVEARDRLSYWVEAVCDTYVQLECDARQRDRAFCGTIESNQLATLGLSRVTASPQSVRRTPAKIARSTEDYFLVSIQIKGHGKVVQDGRVAALSPGDFALYDSTRPYELIFDEPLQQHVLQFPGAVLRSRLRDTEKLTARKVCGARGAGHLMIGMINTLTADIDMLQGASAAAIAESVENILVAGLCSLPGAADPAISHLTSFHCDQIKAYALQRLRDPKLSVNMIAAHLRLSPSTIYRAFAGEPCSLHSWIWNQRLDGAKREICDPALGNRSITEIAFGWGFNDAAHFSRVFRQRFGCSPRELRAEIAGKG
jgi:AraC-like DNA-binding protein